MTTELMVLPVEEKALEAIFIDGSDFDPVIEKIREQAKDLPFDMTVKKNRDEIASFAYKIARSKSAVEKAGAAISAKYKELPKKIDASRRAYKDAFEQLQGEVRAPLNEWEENEAKRVHNHKFALASLTESADLNDECPSETIRDVLDDIFNRVIDSSWEEFEQDAHRAKAESVEKLRAMLDRRVKYEDEQEELEALRKQAAEQAQKDREAQIAAEAAASAKAAAEQASAKAIEDAKRAEEQAKRDLELAEQRRIAQEKQAELDKIAAQKQAEQAAENARIAEIKRAADEQAKADADQARREADKKHKGNINREALASLIAHAGLDDAQAKAVVTAIAKGLISHVSIKY